MLFVDQWDCWSIVSRKIWQPCTETKHKMAAALRGFPTFISVPPEKMFIEAFPFPVGGKKMGEIMGNLSGWSSTRNEVK
jgi:hypothetical protein